MIIAKVLEELNEKINEALNLVIEAEEENHDFVIVRELLEQVKDEIESLE